MLRLHCIKRSRALFRLRYNSIGGRLHYCGISIKIPLESRIVYALFIFDQAIKCVEGL